MTNRPRGTCWTALTRTAFITAPLCMLAYGAIRLSDPGHGPGLAWTSGHLALIVGVMLFGAVFVGLYRLTESATTAGRLSASAATFLGLAGTLAVVAQAAIDLIVGFRSASRPAMNRLFEQIQSHPGVMPAVYTVGPMLFYVGLVWIVVQLAAQRRISSWRPVMVVIGTATMAASLDLIPLGAVLFCAALSPLARDLAAPGRSGSPTAVAQ